MFSQEQIQAFQRYQAQQAAAAAQQQQTPAQQQQAPAPAQVAQAAAIDLNRAIPIAIESVAGMSRQLAGLEHKFEVQARFEQGQATWGAYGAVVGGMAGAGIGIGIAYNVGMGPVPMAATGAAGAVVGGMAGNAGGKALHAFTFQEVPKTQEAKK